jgi:peptidoglycan/LPS O-acetylase OafA/YrhL
VAHSTSDTEDRGPEASASVPATVLFPSSSHIPALDGIRGIAILMVIFYHFTDSRLGGGALIKLLKVGVSGVDLFFVLSGFLITGILFDSKSKQYYFRDFYIRRALRIFPLYYGVLVVVLLVLPYFHVVADAAALRYQAWLWWYASNYLLGGQDVTSLGGLGHFWSLAIEEQFYLVWPLVIYLCGRKTGMWMCVGCMLLSVASRISVVAASDPDSAHRATYLWTHCRMEALAAGAFIALAARGPAGKSGLVRLSMITGLATAAMMGYLISTKAIFGLIEGRLDVLRYTLCAWTAGTLVMLAVAASPTTLIGRTIGCRLLRFFGKYSYGLYVFHWLLLPMYKRFCPPEQLISRFGSPLLGQLAFIVVATGSSVVVAMLSWHLYEKHFLGLKEILAPKNCARTTSQPQDNLLHGLRPSQTASRAA